jgi:chromate transporter
MSTSGSASSSPSQGESAPVLSASNLPGLEGAARVLPGWREMAWTWVKVAALGFGGPAGQIAVMHRILVEEKRWITESRFGHALNYCLLLPGPEAQQLATYLGWLMYGIWGGLVAGGLFILPGVLSMLVMSLVYIWSQDVAWLQALFFGLKAAVVVLVWQAVVRMARRGLKNGALRALAVASFLAMIAFHIGFPWIVLLAGCMGLIGHAVAPALFSGGSGHGSKSGGAADEHGPELPLRTVTPTWGRAAAVLCVGLLLWFTPLVMLRSWQGPESVWYQQGVFFSQAAVVTFGGAYAVLGYVQQRAVEQYGWLTSTEMLDGLGLAESTPGPLIKVVQFVGFLGAYRHAEPLSPLLSAGLGSLVTVWVTFVPSFLWIFLGAPSVERLRGQKQWSAALAGVSAAVTGVVAQLALVLTLQTLFVEQTSLEWGWWRSAWPIWSSVRWDAFALVLVAGVLNFGFKRGLAETLIVSLALGLATRWLIGPS